LCPFHETTGFTLTLLEKVSRTRNFEKKFQESRPFFSRKFDSATGVRVRKLNFLNKACRSFGILPELCFILFLQFIPIYFYGLQAIDSLGRFSSLNVCSLSHVRGRFDVGQLERSSFPWLLLYGQAKLVPTVKMGNLNCNRF